MMKERKHDDDQPDQATAMRHLCAAIAAGLASGPGRSANAVLKRLETKYRKQIDQTNRRSSEAD